MDSKTLATYTCFEHIDVETPDGPARLLVKRHYNASNISGAAYGLDWWRNPETPKKCLLRRALEVLVAHRNA